MKWPLTFYSGAKVTLFLFAVAMVLPVAAAPVKKIAGPETAPRSTFEMPTNPNEGRDPFFPSSLRPYGTLAIAAAPREEAAVLVVKGISYSRNKFFAIINNHTFAAGDEEEVKTSDGHVRVHCLEVTADAVLIEVNGKQRELHFEPKP